MERVIFFVPAPVRSNAPFLSMPRGNEMIFVMIKITDENITKKVNPENGT